MSLFTRTPYEDDTARNWRVREPSRIDHATDLLDLEAQLARAEGDKRRARRLRSIARLLKAEVA